MTDDAKKFIEARDFLLNAENYEEAVKDFTWPHLTKFNWVLDYFNEMAKGNDQKAVIYTDTKGNTREITFHELYERSNKVANFLTDAGMQKGDRVLMMMETSIEIFEIILAVFKNGGVIIPAASLLTPKDISDRIERGNIKIVFAHKPYVEKFNRAGAMIKGLTALIAVNDYFVEDESATKKYDGWIDYEEADKYPGEYSPAFITFTTDPMFMFFTSGTTAKPKLVIHDHSYPLGHLTTMYWVGVKPGDVHYNISSPGWAKYQWSSLFVPWNAGATVFTIRYAQFGSKPVLEAIEKFGIDTLCAPLSVWKLFVQEDLSKYNFKLREIVSAGEPLNPEIIRLVKEKLGITIREGYGQTESTLSIGYFKGVKVKEGSLGKTAPGYKLNLVNDTLDIVEANQDGQIAIEIYPVKPLGLLVGYDDPEMNEKIFKGGWYLTGDTAYRDEEGYFYFVGRNDDVFKSLDYRISPFEVESELMVHHAVVEAAVIPTEDERGRIVPKAFLVLKPEFQPTREMALQLFTFIRNQIAPYKRPRYIEFMEAFPKTISAKVMRKDLRAYNEELRKENKLGKLEFREADFAKELNIRKRK